MAKTRRVGEGDVVWRPMRPLIDWPHKLHMKVVFRSASWEDIGDLLAVAKKIHLQALDLDARVRELEAETLRLQHENDFMLRLINERGTDE